MEIAFAWLAVAMFVVFFAVDVLARGYLHWRSTGSTGTPRHDSGLKAIDFAGGTVAFAGMTTTVAGTVLAATGPLEAVRYLDFTGVNRLVRGDPQPIFAFIIRLACPLRGESRPISARRRPDEKEQMRSDILPAANVANSVTLHESVFSEAANWEQSAHVG